MKIQINKKTGDIDDPKNSINTYQTQAQLDAANMEAKRFAIAHGLLAGQNAYVATKVGDPAVPYIDAKTGKDITGQPPQQYPYGTITDIRQIPSSINGNILKFDTGKRLYYYDDPQSGDPKYVSHEIAASTRFNPNRGTYDQSIAKK